MNFNYNILVVDDIKVNIEVLKLVIKKTFQMQLYTKHSV